MPWFLFYIIPMLLLFVGYAWLVGSSVNDPPTDKAVYPVLFFSILLWPVMLAVMFIVAPFAILADFAATRAASKLPGGESGT